MRRLILNHKVLAMASKSTNVLCFNNPLFSSTKKNGGCTWREPGFVIMAQGEFWLAEIPRYLVPRDPLLITDDFILLTMQEILIKCDHELSQGPVKICNKHNKVWLFKTKVVKSLWEGIIVLCFQIFFHRPNKTKDKKTKMLNCRTSC